MSEESQEFNMDIKNRNQKILLDEDLCFCQDCGHLENWCGCNNGVD